MMDVVGIWKKRAKEVTAFQVNPYVRDGSSLVVQGRLTLG